MNVLCILCLSRTTEVGFVVKSELDYTKMLLFKEYKQLPQLIMQGELFVP